ncbi:LOW QUALITY PROTEIN: kelch domain-containing protein 7A-like [Oncorhynchus mykiss]|uniref:LOW QUALITY PROTEIN: kelch domain-containing protein 7A-like n=1 Tax=Oncorhynchus mykiss TaxID=8022 RepID=UPI001877EE4F|nr:LOW QUALITY PROTEIN: kelch domain-containing protein 7A-like [Oncorhynchus mykiss]
MEGPEKQSVVRGKIYEYCVECSSHSITDSILGLFEGNSLDSQSVEFGRCGSSLTEPPHSRASSSGDPSPVSPLSPTTDTRHPSAWEVHSLETIAGAKCINLPPENSSELEIFKFDLGNCVEVELSKKHGQAPLQQSALRVMSDNYLQILRDPGLYGRLRAGDQDEIQKQRMRGRQFLMAGNMGPQDWVGSSPQGTKREQGVTTIPCSGLYYYDDYKDSWHPLCPIPQEVISKGCAMCTMDNYLFVAVGGSQQGADREMKPSKRVFCYNPVTSKNSWKEISPMNESRPHCKLAALQGYIYAIGGECLSTVERYDPSSDRWTFVAPLPNDTFAVAHHVTVCNRKLFVLGGTLRYTLLHNPNINVWRKSSITGSKERTTEIVGVRNFLYRFDVSPQLGISVYRYHTVARLCYECCTKRLDQCLAFQCVALDDTIYCMSHQLTMSFRAEEISPRFVADDLSVLSGAKGILFPFVLSLPDTKAHQTRV